MFYLRCGWRLHPAFAKNKDTTPGRLLTGKVLDRSDNPVPDAVVYLTDTRTRAVKTYIVGPDGTYRFPALATNVDYEIYAQSKGKTSDTKRMSQFDDRKVVDIPRYELTLVKFSSYCRNPIHFSETTIEFPGFCGS